MNRMAKLSAALTLVMAVTVGVIGKLQPILFLRIPNIGFILWATTGNPVPPYFDVTIYDKKNFHQWAKDGDCIFASGPKSGTVWVHTIIHLLKMNGNDNFTYLMTEHVGLAEFLTTNSGHSAGRNTKEARVSQEPSCSGHDTLFAHVTF